jgi:hypothetical protein
MVSQSSFSGVIVRLTTTQSVPTKSSCQHYGLTLLKARNIRVKSGSLSLETDLARTCLMSRVSLDGGAGTKSFWCDVLG